MEPHETLSRFDLHLHTEYSADCDTSLGAIEAHCLARGLAGIAVTDHNTIEGALKLREMSREIRVIVGEEVSTHDGDVIGLFLKEHVPPRRPAVDVMRDIRAQGGLVYLPHPFDRRRARRTYGASITELLPLIDIIEVFNGKVGKDRYNTMAREFARRHGMTEAGGSDAHSLHAIGTVTTELMLKEGEPMDAKRFMAALAGAQISGSRRSPLGSWIVRGRRPLSLVWRRLRGRAAR